MLVMWCYKLRIRYRNVSKTISAFYSRSSDPKNADSYKLVKHRKTPDDIANTSIGSSPNWELLAPRGYRFYLPGSVGPAWHDSYTTVHLDEFKSILAYERSDSKSSIYALECEVQQCPILLKKGIMELFPGTEFGGIDITVITLSQKSSTDLSSTGQEVYAEQEKLTKFFVLAAQEICMKLRLAGYWADFINPFSGRPYLTPTPANLYEADKSPTWNFHINDAGKCRVINKEQVQSHIFMGSLFTTAPPSTTLLKDVLEQYDEY